MDFMLVVINLIFILLLISSSLLIIVSLPGNLLLFLSMISYAFWDNFIHITYIDLLIVTGLLVVSEVIEFFNGPVLARAKGASTKTIIFTSIGMIIGGIVGSMLLIGIGSVIGAVLCGFITAFYFEYKDSNDIDSAKKIAKAVVKGQILGLFIKFILVIISIIFLISKLSW